MGNKLILIQELPFNDDIAIVANNEKDIIDFLKKGGATEIKIDSYNWISFKLNSYTLSSQLHWVKEI